MGYDYGVPAMVLLVAVFLIMVYFSMKKGYELDNPLYLLPGVLVVAMSVFGWFEMGLGWDNSFSLLIFLCCVLWREEKA